MRAHLRVHARVVGDWHGERRREASLVPQAVEREVHGSELELVTGDDLGDGALEHLGADAVEQLQEPGGERVEERLLVGVAQLVSVLRPQPRALSTFHMKEARTSTTGMSPRRTADAEVLGSVVDVGQRVFPSSPPCAGMGLSLA